MNLRIAVMVWICAAAALARADAEHDRLSSDRAAANALLADEERRCNAQFAVSACLEDARKAHRVTLNRLRREELSLDEAARRAAADARRREIAEKAAAGQARASDAGDAAVAAEPRVHPVPRPATEPALRAPNIGRPRPAGQPASGVSRGEQERRNTEAYEARLRAAEEHRDAVARRNAERAASGAVAAPLPVPSAASGSN